LQEAESKGPCETKHHRRRAVGRGESENEFGSLEASQNTSGERTIQYFNIWLQINIYDVKIILAYIDFTCHGAEQGAA